MAGSWNVIQGKLEYTFPTYSGWGPNGEVIRDSGLFYDCQNIRIDGGVIKSRGGWVADDTTSGGSSTGDYEFTSDGDTFRVNTQNVAISGDRTAGHLRINDGIFQTIAKDLQASSIPDFISAPKIGGKNWLITTQKSDSALRQSPIRYDGGSSPIELTGLMMINNGDDGPWSGSDGGSAQTDFVSRTAGQSGSTYTNRRYEASTTPTNLVYTKASATEDQTTGWYTVGAKAIDPHTFDYGSYSDIDETGVADDSNYLTLAVGATGETANITNLISDLSVLEDELSSSTSITSVTVRVRVQKSSVLGDSPYIRSSMYYSGATYQAGEANNPAEQTGAIYGDFTDLDFVYTTAPDGSAWSSSNILNFTGVGCEVEIVDATTLYVSQIKFFVIYNETVTSWSLSDFNWGDNSADDGDEFVLICHITNSSLIDTANSYIQLRNATTPGSNYIQWDLDTDILAGTGDGKQTSLVDGWNILPVRYYDGTVTGNAAAANLEANEMGSVVFVFQTSSGTATIYIDAFYARKTSIFSSSHGTGTRMPEGKYCEVTTYGDRLLVANVAPKASTTEAGPSYVFYSNAWDIENAANANSYFTISGDITALKTYGEWTHIFTENGRYVAKPNYSESAYSTANSPTVFYVQKAHGPGTPSHKSITVGEYNNKPGFFFVSKRGVYFTNGIEAIPVTGDMSRLWEEQYPDPLLGGADDDWYADSVSLGGLDKCAATWIDNKLYVAYTPRGASNSSVAVNSQIIVLDTRTGKWVKDNPASDVNPYSMASVLFGGRYKLVCGTISGDTFYFEPSRATVTDDGTAYESSFQTPFIGLDVGRNLLWEDLYIWVRSNTTSAKSLVIRIYKMEDWDDTSSYYEWEEDVDSIYNTITQAFTPNNAFTWHRLKIPLRSTANSLYPNARGLSFKIYDDNDTTTDFILEKVVCSVNEVQD